MKERPIVMTAESVQALEAGRKTQTSRLVRLPLDAAEVVVDPGGTDVFGPGPYLKVYKPAADGGASMYPRIYSPFGYPGDRLWVKETWTHITGNGIRTHYRADGDPVGPDGEPLPTKPGTRRWMSPRFMPRKESRFLLEITMVRAMRIRQMTREDVIAEGVFFTDYGKHEHQPSVDGGKTWGVMHTQRAGWSYRKTTSYKQCLGSPEMAFANEWNRIHAGDRWNLKPGPSPWDQNPWVWVYTFRRMP